MISYIMIGFTSIANGECNGALHFFADRFGVSHPMCRVYRDLVSTLFNAFFNQDSQALLRLCVNLSQVIIAPTFGVITVNIFILATGQLLPFFNDEQRVIMNDYMQRDIERMVATRNAVVNTIAHLLSTFRQTVSGTHTPTLNAPQPSNSAQGLVNVGRGGGGNRRRRRITAAPAPASAAASAAPGQSGPPAAPLSEPHDIHDNFDDGTNFGGKKSRRRRRKRGRKSKKR